MAGKCSRTEINGGRARENPINKPGRAVMAKLTEWTFGLLKPVVTLHIARPDTHKF